MAIGIFFLIFCILMIIGLPVAVVFGGMTFLPSLMDPGFSYTIEAAIRSMVNGMDSFTLLAVPMFMLSGIIMARGGISEKLFNFFAYYVGNKTAGLPCAAILTCMFYAAISGSSPATVSAVGAMTIPFLVGLGYDKVFVTAIVTVAGGLGVIIPPSISYIVFSSITNASPSALFIGGIIPGILIGFCLMICAYIYCKKHGEDKEKLKATYGELHRKGFGLVFKESFFALLIPIIILGSIYGGIASPTEAAAISVIYALGISLLVYKTIKLKDLGPLIVEGVRTYVLILLIFGMVMDNIPNIMVLTPILMPVATSIGLHPVHFGIMLTANLAIGMVTPPMGINLYVANSMTGIPVLKIARTAIPFLISFFIALLFISFILIQGFIMKACVFIMET
ncbi:MAG: TRAP transporter large permease subunit [Treponema sp.]|jgi:C4-dicarboxylate transporter DctM subunit|nr:TRAP transporter large permease subunit [Treponema sp.]